MKTRWRPFIQQVQQQVQQLQQTLSNLSTKRLASSNPQAQLLLQERAESRAWEPVMTPDQEASYEDESWVNSAPKSEVQVRLYSKPPHIADLDTVAQMPSINPNPQEKALMSHLCGDTPDKFAAIIGTLIAPTIQDKNIVRRVPTKELNAPKSHITGSLRRANITDPYLSSVQTTPNHEFAIVPRQKATAQLPPRLRLHEDIADAPEHVTAVETLINRAIVTFHQEQQRLPHAITVNMIRFAQHWINTRNHELFFYHTEYGDVEIPIQPAQAGELLTDEVRLD